MIKQPNKVSEMEIFVARILIECHTKRAKWKYLYFVYVFRLTLSMFSGWPCLCLQVDLCLCFGAPWSLRHFPPTEISLLSQIQSPTDIWGLSLCLNQNLVSNNFVLKRSHCACNGVYFFQKLMPAFSVLNTELSEECVFSPARDRYRTQETHKSVEDGTKWYCHFCGKAFVNEYFLDLHFDNRHTDQMEVSVSQINHFSVFIWQFCCVVLLICVICDYSVFVCVCVQIGLFPLQGAVCVSYCHKPGFPSCSAHTVVKFIGLASCCIAAGWTGCEQRNRLQMDRLCGERDITGGQVV